MIRPETKSKSVGTDVLKVHAMRLLWAALLAAFPAVALGAGMNTYRMVELGAGQARLTNDAAGNSVVVGSGGPTEYAFPKTDNRVSTDVAKSFPPVRIDFSSSVPVMWNDVFQNRNGEVVSALSYSVLQAGTPAPGVPMLQIDNLKANDDGSYSHVDRLFGTPIYGDSDPMLSPSRSYIADFNNRGELIYQGLPAANGSAPFRLMDIHAPLNGRDLDAILRSVDPDAGETVHSVTGLDDEGRILAFVGPAGSLGVRPILLVPTGLPLEVPTSVPTTPIPVPNDPDDAPADTGGSSGDPVPIPEPSTLLMLAGGIVAARFGLRRRDRIGKPV